jgi:uncharacterized protein (DUF849 family)
MREPAGTLEPLLIAVAPNGARRTRADHPALPVTAGQLADTASACLDAGASMIHLHARDEDGRHTLDPDACRRAIDAVKIATGGRMLVQMTSESAGIYDRDEQMAAVRAVMPDAVSLAIREIIPTVDSEDEAAAFLAELAAAGVRTQYIVYDPLEVRRFATLRSRSVIPAGAADVLFVLGKYDGVPASPADLIDFLNAMADAGLTGAVRWAVCAFGRRENACALAAAALGGHVRVGFENNLWLADGRTAPDNAALVAQVAEGARLLGRPLADAPAWG